MKLHVGDRIELTEEASSYTMLPKGLRGTITAISGPHHTMNGGGFDVTFTIDDFALAGEIGEAVTSRLRELQAKDPAFYTDRYIAYKATHATVHSDRVVVVTDESVETGEIAGSNAGSLAESLAENAGSLTVEAQESLAENADAVTRGVLRQSVRETMDTRILEDPASYTAAGTEDYPDDHEPETLEVLALREDISVFDIDAGSLPEATATVLAGSRRNAANRLKGCGASHKIDPDDNNWCRTCDTGECAEDDLPVFWFEPDGWYHHIEAGAGECFLIGRDPLEPAAEAREAFHKAVTAFIDAGNALVNAWDKDGFNADEAYPLPERLAPPLSFDEWFAELSEHYARIEA